MRRLPILVPAMLTLLLAVAPVASAASEAPIRDPEFKFQADGFQVLVRGEAESEKVVLTLYRHGQVAYYEVAGKITEDSVKAKFGAFGELEYTFTPGVGKKTRCKGADGTTEGTFSGAFEFTGENDYVSFEADHAHGTFELFPHEGCEEPPKSSKSSARAGRTTARVAAAAAGREEISLTVAAGGKRRADYLLAFSVSTKHRPRILFSAFHAERLPGMLVERGVQVIAGRGALRWDPETGVAHVSPPAPFTGSAVFERRPHGKPIWRGSLGMPVLGGEPVGLTGPRFRAEVGKGSIAE